MTKDVFLSYPLIFMTVCVCVCSSLLLLRCSLVKVKRLVKGSESERSTSFIPLLLSPSVSFFFFSQKETERLFYWSFSGRTAKIKVTSFFLSSSSEISPPVLSLLFYYLLILLLIILLKAPTGRFLFRLNWTKTPCLLGRSSFMLLLLQLHQQQGQRHLQFLIGLSAAPPGLGGELRRGRVPPAAELLVAEPQGPGHLAGPGWRPPAGPPPGHHRPQETHHVAV